jgi:hypothetical protein
MAATQLLSTSGCAMITAELGYHLVTIIVWILGPGLVRSVAAAANSVDRSQCTGFTVSAKLHFSILW